MDDTELFAKLIARPKRQDVIFNALDAYNVVIAEARRRIMAHAGRTRQTPKAVFYKTLEELPSREMNDTFAIAEAESEAEKQRLQERARERHLFYSVLVPLREKIDHGMKLEEALADVPVPPRVPNYATYVAKLEERGIVQRKYLEETATEAVARLLPHQVLVLDRSYNIPPPLSKNLLKEPDISRKEAIDQIVDYLLGEKEKEVIRTVRRGLGRKVVQERVRQEVDNKMKDEKKTHKRYYDELARAMVSDLPLYHRLLLTNNAAVRDAIRRKGQTPSTGVQLNKAIIDRYHLMPEEVFAGAFAQADPSLAYLTGMFRGIETTRQKLMVFDNVDAALRFFAYVNVANGNGDHEAVATALLTDRVLYANTLGGNVMSRTDVKKTYRTTVVPLPVFSSRDNVEWRTPWDIELTCHCPDGEYMRDRHAKAQYPFMYIDTHPVILGMYGMDAVVKKGGFVINPFPCPTEAGAEFTKKLEGQVLVNTRRDDSYNTLNRAERERLRIQRGIEVGYHTMFTHNLDVALDAVKAVRLVERQLVNQGAA
jgi:hypothetical protein